MVEYLEGPTTLPAPSMSRLRTLQNSPGVQRVVMAVLPAILILGIGLSSVFGEAGAVRRQAVRANLVQANDDLASLERDNQRMLLDLSALRRDPVAVERAIADEISYARDGAVIYRFQ